MEVYIEGNTLHIGSETLDLSHLPAWRIQTLQEALARETAIASDDSDNVAEERARDAANDAMLVAVDIARRHTLAMISELENM